MTKCGKSFMPECEYFTTGGCVSPFNCPYKTEQEVKTGTRIPWNLLYPLKTEKDKEIARLTAENNNLSVELEMTQRDIETLTRTLEETNEEIKALEAENTWKKACELACEDLQFYDYGNEIKKDGIKMKLDYFYQQAEKELQEEKKDD